MTMAWLAPVAGAVDTPSTEAATTITDKQFSKESARLASGMAAAVRGAKFNKLVDFENVVNKVAQKAKFLPNVDVAVIELTADGQVGAVANVLYDRDNSQGYTVKVDRASMSTTSVKYAEWNQERADDKAKWKAGPAADEVLANAAAKKSFMSPYPASVLKVMVAYSVVRLVDQGKLKLDDKIVYEERNGETCGASPSNPTKIDPAPVAQGATDTVDGWMDKMITVSDNFATCVLLQEIFDQGALDAANAEFADLGLSTLRMRPRVPEVGTGWLSGTMTMSALDTARLMLLNTEAAGVLWTTPAGRAVSVDVLSAASRDYLRSLLADQSFNEVLNPVNLCGSTDAVQGIPSLVSPRWVDPADGHVKTYDGDTAIDFGYDVRPCVDKAEVIFLHKTGLTSNAGSDTGIVGALDGQDGRVYIVAIQSSIGSRFGDPDWAKSDPDACLGAPYVCYPRGFGRIGKSIDTLVKKRPSWMK
jgi:hypothetical protein